jgi:hypothetical protein
VRQGFTFLGQRHRHCHQERHDAYYRGNYQKAAHGDRPAGEAIQEQHRAARRPVPPARRNRV